MAARLRRLLRVVIVPVLAPLAPADAHVHAGIVASDYGAAVARMPRVPAPVLQARIYATDRALVSSWDQGASFPCWRPRAAVLLRIDARRLHSTVCVRRRDLGRVGPRADTLADRLGSGWDDPAEASSSSA